jgi:hypothetical protein
VGIREESATGRPTVRLRAFSFDMMEAREVNLCLNRVFYEPAFRNYCGDKGR